LNLLDMRTVLLSYTISSLICLMVLAVLWRQNRARFAGLGLWLADFALHLAGLALLSLRGAAPDWLAVTGGNVLIIAGALLLYMGLERFTGRRGPQAHNIALVAAFALAHAYFTLARPSLVARSLLFNTALLALSIQGAWLMLRRAGPEMRAITRYVGYVLAAFCLSSLARIGVELCAPPQNDFFHSSVYETLLMLVSQTLFIALTLTLILMVNHRLVADLEEDIARRTRVEAALRLSEEKFSKAFRSSPDAIIITRLQDGRFVEINDGFCRLTGYSRQEALNSSTTALNMWANPRERGRFVAALRAESHVRDFEIDVRTRSGKIRNSLCNSEVIELAGEMCVLSVIRDHTERKLTEAVTRLRLMLWEYSTTHSVNEIMQKALDEIEALTGSQIGFYHAVEAEQEMLTLYAWSTRTRAEFCKAEGEGMHYPIEQAGVWVDCIREEKPVIHNDYASLPHRKGLPEGHAEVVRELVAPTMRGGRVVAILGVGNKATDYDEEDVELVTYIADVVWSIIVQKQAIDQIPRLNKQLERLVMTDELTGLQNRRAFFAQGNAELKRARRYGTPVSLLMLDLDSFKEINDTYGHAAGDAILQLVGKTLREITREVDATARLGGEEFGILLPNTKAADAVILAGRVRQAVEEIRCSVEGQIAQVTASIGVAEYSGGMQNLDTLLRSADAAMYQAKSQGRNRVVLSEV
jgi:diguanylate cyclase (GGDEF)-like protein/PAS domain S-box-containing protein